MSARLACPFFGMQELESKANWEFCQHVLRSRPERPSNIRTVWGGDQEDGVLGSKLINAEVAAQVTPTNIVYALVDSSDWIEGVELRLCMTPPKQPFQRCPSYLLYPFTAPLHSTLSRLFTLRTLQHPSSHANWLFGGNILSQARGMKSRIGSCAGYWREGSRAWRPERPWRHLSACAQCTWPTGRRLAWQVCIQTVFLPESGL